MIIYKLWFSLSFGYFSLVVNNNFKNLINFKFKSKAWIWIGKLNFLFWFRYLYFWLYFLLHVQLSFILMCLYLDKIFFFYNRIGLFYHIYYTWCYFYLSKTIYFCLNYFCSLQFRFAGHQWKSGNFKTKSKLLPCHNDLIYRWIKIEGWI